jgi:hypothetical protein
MFAIAQSFFVKVLILVNKLFAKLRSAKSVVQKEPKATPEPRKPRKYNKEKSHNFSELLDHLEHTFEAVKLPAFNSSWLNKDSIIGLKKLGAHVPNPWLVKWQNNGDKVDITKPLPTLMCISTSSKSTINNGDNIYPKVMFAIKHKKLPWNVAYQSGAPYQFGMAYDLDGKLFWSHMFITVNRKTGEIKFCDELRVHRHLVPVRSNTERRINGPYKKYFTKSWMPAEFLEDDRRTIDESRENVRNLFIAMHQWWSERDTRWNVVVKKNGERVTFGVDNKDTPYYFKDRDKTIKTPTGQAKKIVHYVKEHERKYGDKTTLIKEHIRGLQEFEWTGYHCKVVSPKLQSQTSATFQAPPRADDEERIENIVYLSKVGKLLADAEENTNKEKKYA